ncbi:MAG: hypothetical protein H8D23_41085 [Candidatus Brocadiales bacterium]|nr:hypothetical protein [Candidatus Brocadiales bacterium]
MNTQITTSERTIFRYLNKATANAMVIQQLIREVIIDAIEPKPVETLFKGGLDPPAFFKTKYRQSLPAISKLWRSFAILTLGLIELNIQPCNLLARARKKANTSRKKFLF